MTIFLPDLSNNNWGSRELTDEGQQNQLTFLNGLRGLGIAALTHKMSQGIGYTDPYGRIAQTWCAKNRFAFIGYHWATTDDPAAQVNNWLAAGGGDNVEIDFEDMAGGEPTLDMVLFWDLVDAFNGANVNVALAYLPEWYADRIGADLSPLASNGIALHSSAYPLGYSVGGSPEDIYRGCDGDAGEGWAPYLNGPPPTLWQFTSSASVGGLTVDCNAYHGTKDQLAQLFTGAP